ncbi:MAG TPA: enoyl-CoA hydratase-related protein [Gemmatimonadales bacterium]|nr:enoyl-CoA hydratase-related protein [Gemmatimonadales bacterium]
MIGTEAQAVRVQVEGPVATLTLNRPEKLNAFTVAMAAQLGDELERLAADHSLRAVIITGEGRAFCAGADLEELKRVMEQRDLEYGLKLVGAAHRFHAAIRSAPWIAICAINGVAAGGGANLALGCDLRIASDTAKIGQVFARIGLHPDWGGSFFLPRMVGTARALELFLSAELVDSGKLLDYGLVNRVVPASRLMVEARAWADRVAAAPPLAARLIKQAVYRSADASLTEMLDFELEAQRRLFASGDFAEGLTAFLEKRSPRFGAH